MLAVVGSARAGTTTPRSEDTLSRELRTPPLPATHVAVANSWQNRRLCQHYAAQQLRQRPRVALADCSARLPFDYLRKSRSTVKNLSGSSFCGKWPDFS